MNEPKYKLVPVSQLDKVESIRLALHGIADWLDSQEMNVSALRVRAETQKLWDVANRQYQDAAPSHPQDPRDEALRVAREVLSKYAHHKPHCLSLSAYYIEVACCTCGLDADIHKIKELMGEK